jgi:peroxiredoxin
MRRESDTLQPGAKAPDFTLADPQGVRHHLRDLLSGDQTVRRTKLLLVFDRGTW